MRRQAIGVGTPVLAAMLFFAAAGALAQTEQGGEQAPNAPVEAPGHDGTPPTATAASHPPPTQPQHVPAMPPGVGPGATPPPGTPAQAAPPAEGARRLGRQFPSPVQPPTPSEPPQVHITVVPSSEPSVGRSRIRNGGGGGGGGEGGGLAEDGDSGE